MDGWLRAAGCNRVGDRHVAQTISAAFSAVRYARARFGARHARKRYRITLLFNANKVYDRQVVEGVGEYLQASQTDGISSLKRISAHRQHPRMAGRRRHCGLRRQLDREPAQQCAGADCRRWWLLSPPAGLSAGTTSPPTTLRWWRVPSHLKERHSSLCVYGLPAASGNASRSASVSPVVMTAAGKRAAAQNRLADWLQTLPPQTGIIGDRRACASFATACEHLKIPVPEKLSVIGIDNEELTRYLSAWRSSVARARARWVIRPPSCCIACSIGKRCRCNAFWCRR